MRKYTISYSFAELARAARVVKGKTQKQVAGLVGISSNYYTRVEAGKLKPSQRLAARIASVMGFKAPKPDNSKKIRRLRKKLTMLRRELRKIA